MKKDGESEKNNVRPRLVSLMHCFLKKHELKRREKTVYNLLIDEVKDIAVRAKGFDFVSLPLRCFFGAVLPSIIEKTVYSHMQSWALGTLKVTTISVPILC